MRSIEARSNTLFKRNGFCTAGHWEMPVVEKQEIPLDGIELISFSDTKANDIHNSQKAVHFFIDDYKFEGVYRNPERSLPRLSQYKFLLTPDYSTYSDMNYWRQLESVAHSRWIGAYWQDQGQLVVPTVSWSDSKSFEFCFDGIEKGSVVAVGMIGCKRSKSAFLHGYEKMLEVIEPSSIICCGTPFEEMSGNVIAVDYLKSRKVVR